MPFNDTKDKTSYDLFKECVVACGEKLKSAEQAKPEDADVEDQQDEPAIEEEVEFEEITQ